MIRYIDTSAALKLVIEEPESEALAAELDAAAAGGDELVSSYLLWTELHCAAQRRREIDPTSINAVLDMIGLVDLSRADLLRAASSAWGLRSADAIHLAVALHLEADQLVAYDQEVGRVAQQAGLSVCSPRPAAS